MRWCRGRRRGKRSTRYRCHCQTVRAHWLGRRPLSMPGPAGVPAWIRPAGLQDVVRESAHGRDRSAGPVTRRAGSHRGACRCCIARFLMIRGRSEADRRGHRRVQRGSTPAPNGPARAGSVAGTRRQGRPASRRASPCERLGGVPHMATECANALLLRINHRGHRVNRVTGRRRHVAFPYRRAKP